MTGRPATIVWAEWAGLASAALGLVREILVWDQRVALDGQVLAFIFTLGAPVLGALLVLAVTRAQSKAALAALILLTLLAWLTTAKLGLTDGGAAFTTGAASLIAGTLGVGLLLLPRSLRYVRVGRAAPVTP